MLFSVYCFFFIVLFILFGFFVFLLSLSFFFCCRFVSCFCHVYFLFTLFDVFFYLISLSISLSLRAFFFCFFTWYFSHSFLILCLLTLLPALFLFAHISWSYFFIANHINVKPFFIWYSFSSIIFFFNCLMLERQEYS